MEVKVKNLCKKGCKRDGSCFNPVFSPHFQLPTLWLKVGKSKWLIRVYDPPRSCSSDVRGCCDPKTRIIRIVKGDYLAERITHELNHALLEEAGLNIESADEQLVNRLTVIMSTRPGCVLVSNIDKLLKLKGVL